MAQRLTDIPMSTENYNEEREFISDLGRKNGYQEQTIERIIKKHQAKLRIRNLTSHLPELNPSPFKYISTPYYPEITKKLSKVVKNTKFN
jgi:hypothetical protein